MDLDFFVDDNGKIWLFYGKNIVARPMKKTAMQLLSEASQMKNYQAHDLGNQLHNKKFLEDK